MKRFFILLQWLLLVVLAASALYAVFRSPPQPERNPAEWKSWYGFMAVSYAGIGRHESSEYPSRKRLAEQLTALRQAGYHTITTKDAAAFLDGRAPLPERALLLLFEGGRKDSFLYATPLLQRTGFLATVCVPTRLTEQYGSFYLKKGELRRVARLPQWSFASMGHRAIQDVHVDPQGKPGHFLTHRMWSKKGIENEEAFRERVSEDYSQSAGLLERVLGARVDAYLYPFADSGKGSDADPLAAQFNRIALEMYFNMAFTRADDPFNGLDGDPFNLTRLRVPGTWSGSRLVAELEKFLPQHHPVNSLTDERVWLFQQNVRLVNGEMVIAADSAAWLRGSDAWTDADVSADISRSTNALTALYARYLGMHSYFRVLLISNGVRVQERLGDRMETLAWHSVLIPDNTVQNLRLRVKGNRAWVWLNEELVAGPLPLAPNIVRGRVGVNSDSGTSKVLRFSGKPIVPTYALVDKYADLPTDSRCADVRAVLPIWFKPDVKADVDAGQRSELLAAAAAGIETIPVVKGVEGMEPAAGEAMAAGVVAALQDPLIKVLVTHIAIEGLNEAFSKAIRANGRGVVSILTPAQALAVTNTAQLPGPNDMLLIDSSGQEGRSALTQLLHICPADRLVLLQDAPVEVPSGVRVAIRFASTPEKGR